MPQNNAALYGENRGAAQIIDTTSGAQNAFANLLAKKQAERQQELKQLADQQAALKPGALRNDEELQNFLKYQNDWKQQSMLAANERDPYKKALAKSNSDLLYQKAQNFVSRSQQAQKDEQPVGTLLNDPLKRYEYDPNAIRDYTDNLNRSIDNPAYIKNIGLHLKASPDNEYFGKTTKGINDNLINGTVKKIELSPITKDAMGNPIQYQNEVQRIDPLDLAHQIANRASFVNGVPNDPKYYNALKSRNSDLFANIQNEEDHHNAINLAAARESQRGQLLKPGSSSIYKPTDKETDDEKYALWLREYQHRLHNPLYALAPAQVMIAGNPQNGTLGMLQGNVNAMKQFIGLTPKGQYGNSAIPEPVIDPTTGVQTYTFPPHQVKDLKAEKTVQAAREKYDQTHKQGAVGKFFGMKPDVPFDQSEQGKKIIALNPIYKEKKPAATYSLNPADPQRYVADANAMATDQGIKLPSYNQILGQKGGHGIIPLSVPHKKADPLGLGL